LDPRKRMEIWNKYHVVPIEDNLLTNRSQKDNATIVTVSRGVPNRIDITNLVHYLTLKHFAEELNDEIFLFVGEIRKFARGIRTKSEILYNTEKIREFIGKISNKIHVVNQFDLLEKYSLEALLGSVELHPWVYKFISDVKKDSRNDLNDFEKKWIKFYIKRKNDNEPIYPKDYLLIYPYIAWETIINCGLLSVKADFFLCHQYSIGLYLLYQQVIKHNPQIKAWKNIETCKNIEWVSPNILCLKDFITTKGNEYIKGEIDLNIEGLRIIDNNEIIDKKFSSAKDEFLLQIVNRILVPFIEYKFEAKKQLTATDKRDIRDKYVEFITPYRNNLEKVSPSNLRILNPDETRDFLVVLLGEQWSKYEKIFRIIAKNPGITTDEIRDFLKIPKSTIINYLNYLKQLNIIIPIYYKKRIGYQIKENYDRLLLDIKIK
jgi:hypothetical protein